MVIDPAKKHVLPFDWPFREQPRSRLAGLSYPDATVITGFNTDVEHDGVVYHVQTEDKGLASPLILSLVYSRGEILASKRSRYEDLIAKGFTDEALSERLKRQHLLICAAIRAGRLEELKRMAGQAQAEATGSIAAKSKAKPKTKGKTRATSSAETIGSETIIERATPAELGSETIIERAAPAEFGSETIIERAASTDLKASEPVMETATPEEDETEITQETVLTRPHLPDVPTEPPVEHGDAYSIHDQRRASPLGELPLEEGIRLSLLDEHDFRAGDSLTLRIMVSYMAGNDEKPMSGAAVSVKVLGTTFRPQIYSMKTKRDGVAIVSAQIPEFTSGRAAILIRAVTNGSETELRRVIHPA